MTTKMSILSIKVWLYFQNVSETKIEKTDRLNRRLDWKVKIEKYNENKKLKEEWIYRSVEEGPEINILEK